MEQKNIFDKIKTEIAIIDLDEESKQALLKKIGDLQNKKINILLAGATGVGKSSTINALFGKQVASVGEGVNPETNKIEKFILGNIILWDTPGLGDGPEVDQIFAQNIINMLHEKDKDGSALIDVVLVILDASARDLGTAYELINKVILPNISEKKRILVALNQCDFAMKGKFWNYEINAPKEKLEEFLQQKVSSVAKRIEESTEIEIKPIYYSALYKYNISKLFFYMLESTPDEKRLIYLNQLNQDNKVWQSNDDLKNYNAEIKKNVEISFKNVLGRTINGVQIGAKLGKMIPVVGPIIGGIIGGFLGFMGGILGEK